MRRKTIIAPDRELDAEMERFLVVHTALPA
jgi:hypothetical protein